jgi:hypothetical protein
MSALQPVLPAILAFLSPRDGECLVTASRAFSTARRHVRQLASFTDIADAIVEGAPIPCVHFRVEECDHTLWCELHLSTLVNEWGTTYSYTTLALQIDNTWTMNAYLQNAEDAGFPMDDDNRVDLSHVEWPYFDSTLFTSENACELFTRLWDELEPMLVAACLLDPYIDRADRNTLLSFSRHWRRNPKQI